MKNEMTVLSYPVGSALCQLLIMSVRSRTPATSKKKGFVLMTNGFPSLTSFTKIFILDVSVVLDLLIIDLCFEMCVLQKSEYKLISKESRSFICKKLKTKNQ